MTSNQWEYLQHGVAIGPVDELDLRAMLESGALVSSTPVRYGNMASASWRPALAVDEFKDLFVQKAGTKKEEIAVEIAPGSDVGAELPMAKIETKNLDNHIPVESHTAKQEGARVVKWMWRFAIAAWVICFLPVPGLSTFLVWLFVAVSSTLAFVALFKNRVGAGIAGSIALAVITPAVYFLSLSVYPVIFGKIASEEAARARLPAQGQNPSYSESSSSAATPPGGYTVRHRCLEYKCGGYTGRVTGGAFEAFADYDNPSSRIKIPTGSTFEHEDTVSVTSSPGIARVTRRVRDQQTGHLFNRGDLVYLYAYWGEGCFSAWSKGQEFALQVRKEELKNKILCINEQEFLNVEKIGVRKMWTYAKFTTPDGNQNYLYFDGEAMQSQSCIENSSC